MSYDEITDREGRLRLLREKVRREGLTFPEDVLEYIASKYALPQTLKGALVQVAALASHRGVPVDLALARRALGEPTPAPAAEGAADSKVPASAGAGSAAGRGSTRETATAKAEPRPRARARGATRKPLAAPGPGQGALDLGVREAAPGGAGPSGPPARVYFAPVRTTGKRSLVARAGQLLERAGLANAVAEDDLVAIKMHFGEEGNTGFVQPVFVREVVSRVRGAGGKPFLTDSNTLYRGQRANAIDHLACAVHNGFSFATVGAPIVIADGLDGRDAVDVPIEGFEHFDSVRIGAAAVHADALVVVTHVKGHEAVGFGGALKNVGMGLGCRSAKQRMHSDFSPEPDPTKCTACGRCVGWCPVDAIAIGPDRVAHVDHELCYGCGECVAACPYGAIAIQWKTTPEAIQEKIVEHVAGALADKGGKVVYLSFVTDVSPDCDCWHFSDASVVPDIGVLASIDPVAIDQAAYDLVVAAAGLPGSRGEGMEQGQDKFREITGIDGTAALHYAERMGLGTREYELVTVE